MLERLGAHVRSLRVLAHSAGDARERERERERETGGRGGEGGREGGRAHAGTCTRLHLHMHVL